MKKYSFSLLLLLSNITYSSDSKDQDLVSALKIILPTTNFSACSLGLSIFEKTLLDVLINQPKEETFTDNYLALATSTSWLITFCCFYESKNPLLKEKERDQYHSQIQVSALASATLLGVHAIIVHNNVNFIKKLFLF